MNKKTVDIALPELTFATARYGRRETPMDLRILIYKGAASESILTVFNKISCDIFRPPTAGRIELVQHIYNRMNGVLISGGSQATAVSTFYALRVFFRWMDEQNLEITTTTIERNYQQWADHLYSRFLKKQISMRCAATSLGYPVSNVLSAILEKIRPLISSTRLEYSAKEKKYLRSDKLNLEDIFTFGHLLQTLVNNLDIKAIFGPLPVRIDLDNDLVWEEWSGLQTSDSLVTLSPEYRGNQSHVEIVKSRRAARDNDHSIETRFPLINLRIQAELLIFIAQTGMNMSQVQELKMMQFSYKSNIDGYQVRDYKNRRKGEVLFEIFSEYRDHFNQYLTWRKEIFGDSSDLLFPIVRKGGISSSPIQFTKIINICKKANIPFCGPQRLRKTRINWILRKSRDPDLTSEQAQHTKQVLLEVYEEPSFQVAKVEIIQFWQKNDPTLQKISPAPAPGICDGTPEPIKSKPLDAPNPDCIHPNGCLFCKHHRDIDSEDYVWSTASMRHFNSMILSGYRPIKKNKSDIGRHIELALEILAKKLKWFENSNEVRKKWVDEALALCLEGNFHPHWKYLIESIEG